MEKQIIFQDHRRDENTHKVEYFQTERTLGNIKYKKNIF